MKNMPHANLKNLIRFFYSIIMPTITIIGLLIISQIISRDRFLGSEILDIITRLLLCLWFCAGYTRMPNLPQKYRLYPNISWTKSNINPSVRFVYIGIGIIFGIVVSIISWWTIGVFLPIFERFSILFAAANGLIIAAPLIIQYEVFKL